MRVTFKTLPYFKREKNFKNKKLTDYKDNTIVVIVISLTPETVEAISCDPLFKNLNTRFTAVSRNILSE